MPDAANLTGRRCGFLNHGEQPSTGSTIHKRAYVSDQSNPVVLGPNR